jgi:hypothetical protein
MKKTFVLLMVLIVWMALFSVWKGGEGQIFFIDK